MLSRVFGAECRANASKEQAWRPTQDEARVMSDMQLLQQDHLQLSIVVRVCSAPAGKGE